jgi:hypothetical protein
LNESKVATRYTRDGIDDVGLQGLLGYGVEPELDPLTINDLLELASAQGLELVNKPNS